MTVIITGVAGLIGTNLAVSLLEAGHEVVGIDDFSLGHSGNVEVLSREDGFEFVRGDVSDPSRTVALFESLCKRRNVDEVWHLAANSNIPAGVADSEVDLRRTFMTTYSVLAAMKQTGIPSMYFASSSAVYGDHKGELVSESTGPLLPISNYGAMKLASEAAISAASEAFLDKACIFRFPNVVGTPATHGVLLDFVRKLQNNPQVLTVLGDGSQKKPYLHVSELVDAMLFLGERSTGVEIFNLGPQDDGVLVSSIADIVISEICPGAEIQYGIGDRGWIGDVPRFAYSTRKSEAAGWSPRMSSEAAVRRAVTEIIDSLV